MRIEDSCPSFALIDLGAFEANVRAVRHTLRPGVKLLAVLKADAYGHGAPLLAEAAIKAGAFMLGVATLVEGIELRNHGIEAPILVLGPTSPTLAGEVVRHGLEHVVFDRELAEALSAAASSCGRRAAVHLKVDTGMGRLGLWPEEVPEFLSLAEGLKGLELRGLMTHLASAERVGEPENEAQLRRFASLVDSLGEVRERLLIHCANSAATMNNPEAHWDMVRVGIALYGAPPARELEGRLPLKPVMSWRSRIVQLKSHGEGSPIGYGGTYRTRGRCRIATVAVGYGDGYSRRLSNRGEVLVGGRRAPVVGRVSMDMITVDVSHVPEAGPGDEVVLLGSQGEETIGAGELSELLDTIPYELFCTVGKRVPRIFHRDGRPA